MPDNPGLSIRCIGGGLDANECATAWASITGCGRCVANSCSTASGKIKAGGALNHTRWTNGGVYYSGFTTAIPPNSSPLVLDRSNDSSAGQMVQMDWDSVDENDGGPTYMNSTATSRHPGGVNAAFGDGSVRFIKNSVDASVWRGLGSIAGGEVVKPDSY